MSLQFGISALRVLRVMVMEPETPFSVYDAAKRTGVCEQTLYPLFERLAKAQWLHSELKMSTAKQKLTKTIYHLTPFGLDEASSILRSVKVSSL